MLTIDDIVNIAKSDKTTDNNGLSEPINIVKDFDISDIEKYEDMSKTELSVEVKNSEHSVKVIEFIRGLIASK